MTKANIGNRTAQKAADSAVCRAGFPGSPSAKAGWQGNAINQQQGKSREEVQEERITPKNSLFYQNVPSKSFPLMLRLKVDSFRHRRAKAPVQRKRKCDGAPHVKISRE